MEPELVVKKLYVYPIKSILGLCVPEAKMTDTGFEYDRIFILVRKQEDGSWKTVAIAHNPEMCLFRPEILKDDKENPTILVTQLETGDSLEIPLKPDTSNLEKTEMTLWNSGTTAYDMGDKTAEFFGKSFDFPVRLLYLGSSRRKTLGNTMNAPAKEWGVKGPTKVSVSSPNLIALLTTIMYTLYYYLATFLLGLPSIKSGKKARDIDITFADISPFLITSETSFKELQRRVKELREKEGILGISYDREKRGFKDDEFDGTEYEITKMRPNILIGPKEGSSLEAWDEDYWKRLEFGDDGKATIHMTANCGRCNSLNVDYSKGTYFKKAIPIKTLMKDRRVDKGLPYSPIFGKYGCSFDRDVTISIHDKVTVAERSPERSTFDWPLVQPRPMN